MNKLYVSVLSVLLGAMTLGASNADVIEYNLPGTSDVDVWTNGSISVVSNPGFPGFSSTDPWPNPIASSIGGDATLNKTADGAGGGPYPASQSIYFGSFDGGNNGGQLTVTDTTPVAGLQNVVFQVELAGDFFDMTPTLNYTTAGGTQSIAAFSSGIVDTEDLGFFMGEPNFSYTYAYQWNLSSVVDPITSFDISWNAFEHSQIYELRLDQSDTFTAVAVPEPASMAVLGLAMGGVAFRKWRRRKGAVADQYQE
jgi:hypothetical protein